MEKKDLTSHLDFVREQIKFIKDKISELEKGNWNKNISGDYDKEHIYNEYKIALRSLQYILSWEYDCEDE